MPASNLAKIFGPTIVGYSSLDPEPITMLNETKKQAAVSNCYASLNSALFSDSERRM
jgi:Rac GTPase-activating protein 1